MTVSQPLALKMKEAGFPQESEFWWVKVSSAPVWGLYRKIGLSYSKTFGKVIYDDSIEEKAAAPTITEILNELPQLIVNTGYYCRLRILKKDGYYVNYLADNCKVPLERTFANTFEEALGEMYLLLKKERII